MLLSCPDGAYLQSRSKGASCRFLISDFCQNDHQSRAVKITAICAMQWMLFPTGPGASRCSNRQQWPGTMALLGHSGELQFTTCHASCISSMKMLSVHLPYAGTLPVQYCKLCFSQSWQSRSSAKPPMPTQYSRWSVCAGAKLHTW